MMLFNDIYMAPDPHFDSWKKYFITAPRVLTTYDIYVNFLLISEIVTSSNLLPNDIITYIAYHVFTYDVKYSDVLKTSLGGCAIKYMNHYAQNNLLHNQAKIHDKYLEALLEMVKYEPDITLFSTLHVPTDNKLKIYRNGDLFLGIGFANRHALAMISECKLCIGPYEISTLFKFDNNYTINTNDTNDSITFYYNPELPVIPVLLIIYYEIYLQFTLVDGYEIRDLGKIFMLYSFCNVDIRNKLVTNIYESTQENHKITIRDGSCFYD